MRLFSHHRSPIALSAVATDKATKSEPHHAHQCLAEHGHHPNQAQFERLDARAKIRTLAQNCWEPESGRVVIDVRHDQHGEFFDIWADQDADVEVLDVQPRDRYLLLIIRRPNQRPHQPDIKDKLLCGHDERHWFVAGVPDQASTVVTAKESLNPNEVRRREQGKRGKRSKRAAPQKGRIPPAR